MIAQQAVIDAKRDVLIPFRVLTFFRLHIQYQADLLASLGFNTLPGIDLLQTDTL